MALVAPKSIEVEDIQFKLRTKFPIFKQQSLRNNINLIAVSQSVGLVCVGDPNIPEFKVLQLKSIYGGEKISARQVPLPNVPNNLAISCDGSLLAVNYTQNGVAFIGVYVVQSLTSANIQNVVNIRISSEENVTALQILWNPVMSNMFAIVLSDGSLGMYSLSEKKDSYEFQTINKTEQVKCACWSPKGKQIVVGFPNGKICQYKPDLKQARVISCNIQPAPFDIIALQWLSTYQFAAVFLQPEGSPNLYIVNAPKIGAPSFINYFDICYSFNGPRSQQVTLMHIQPWNILMMSSSNSQEIGILGTKETGETPFWNIYLLEGESRIEIPLNEDKEDGFPIGFTLDIGTSHQVIIAEKELPVMPMVHVLSTYGLFLAYDFLNLAPSAPGICSPSPPPADTSGLNQFKLIEQILGNNQMLSKVPVIETKLSNEFNFNPLGSTSTPAVKDKPKPLFSAFAQSSPLITPISVNTIATPLEFQQQTPTNFSFSDGLLGQPASNKFTFNMGGSVVPEEPKNDKKDETTKSIESTKPLHKVPPVYTPPQSVGGTQSVKQQSGNKSHSKDIEQSAEMREIGKQIVSTLLNSFGCELRQFISKTGGDFESKYVQNILKNHNDRLVALHEIHDRANEKDFEIEMQNLRHSLKEAHTMLIETQTKMDMYKNPELVKISVTPNELQINRRHLTKLRGEINKIESQLYLIQQRIDSQWSNYQDIVKSNLETKIRAPSLERVYQALTNEKDILARTRQKLRLYKAKANSKLLTEQTKKSSKDLKMDSITSSMLSVSLLPSVEENKLSEEKALALVNVLDNRKEHSLILPQRPNRVGLKSEVILETKTKMKKQREACSLLKMEQQRIDDQKPLISKPTATKPSPTTVSSNVSFGLLTKPKTTVSVAQNKSVEPEKPISFGKPIETQTSAAPMAISFGKKSENNSVPSPTISFGKKSESNSVPSPTISFGKKSESNSVPSPTISFGKKSESNSVPSPTISFGKKSESNGVASTAISFGKKAESNSVPSTTTVTATPISFSAQVFGGDPKPITPSFGLPKPILFSSVSGGESNKENDTKKGINLSTPFGQLATGLENSNLSAVTEKSAFQFNPSGSTGFPFGGTPLSGSAQASSKLSVSSNDSITQAKVNETANNNIFSGFGMSTKTTTASSIAPSFNFSSFGTTTTTVASPFATKATDSDGLVTSSISFSSPSTSSTFSFASFGITSATAAATSTTTSTSKSFTKPTITSIFGSTTQAVPSDPSDELLGNLNICKPTALEEGKSQTSSELSTTSALGGSIFSGMNLTPTIFGGVESVKPVSPVTSTINTPPASPASATLSLSSPNTTVPTTTSASSLMPTSTETSQAVSTTVVTSVIEAPSLIKTDITPTSAFGAITTTSTSVFGQTVTSGTGSPGFSSTFFNSTPAATSTGSIFGGTTGTSPVVTTSPSIFGSSSISASPFGAVSSSPFTNTATSSNPINSGGSLFSGFGSQQTATIGGSIFGGTSGSFGGTATTTTSTNIFGAAASATTSPSQGIFAAASASTSLPSSGIFASAAASTQPPSSGSVFGQNVFNQTGQSTGSMFGSPSSTPTGIGFSTGSMFGSSAAANTSGGQSSIFGGASQQQPASNQSFGTFGDGNMFGQSSFGSPSQTGSFAQGGPSIAQTGFGSPGSSFQKPVIGSGAPLFGSPAAFGSAPSFGGPPSFGGTATFGSPKGFGSFASVQTPAAFSSPPTQKNSLFESLGQSEAGLSFGNLAQSGNENSNKPAFGGGSAFMNYRA